MFNLLTQFSHMFLEKSIYIGMFYATILQTNQILKNLSLNLMKIN